MKEIIEEKRVKASSLIKDSLNKEIFSVPFGPWNPDKADHFAGTQSTKGFFINQGGGSKHSLLATSAFAPFVTRV